MSVPASPAAADAQVDGASASIGGSELTEVDGEVILNDGDNSAPIYSAARWDELGLYGEDVL